MSAEDDLKAKNLILQVLRSKPMAALSFTLDGRKVTPAMYESVAKAIEGKKITVLVDTVSEDGAGAAYIYQMKRGENTVIYDVLAVRFSEISRESNARRFKQLADIVHECTHAAFDILKTPNMTHLHHEAAAYVAGALYQVVLFTSEGGDPSKISFGDAKFAAAWEIAVNIAANRALTKEMTNKLNTAISNDPIYKDNVNKIVPNDGVGKDWIINGKKVKAA